MLLETIRFHQGELENLFYHQQRIHRSRKELFGRNERWDLEEMITIPEHLNPEQTYRCRVVYGAKGLISVEFIPYSIRPIQSLELVTADSLDYAYKFSDRTALNELTAQTKADEILIVKQGLITDTSYTNVALSDGQEWYTPHQPLLAGTRRAALLANGTIIPERLATDDLRYFKEIRLFNAMIDWHQAPTLPISAIR